MLEMKKYIFHISLVFFLVSVALAGFVFRDKFFSPNRNSSEDANLVFQKKEMAGKVLGEEEEEFPNEFEGEKYCAPQLSFGGGLTAFYPGIGEPMGPLDIENVQSEIVRTKEKKELQIIVSWRTKRPTKCSVDYAKSGGSPKSAEEEFFTVDHSAVLGNLESSSTYFFTITAKDKLGGEASSDKFAVYTGAPEVSFFDLLAGAFKDAFGWATKN